MNPANIFEDAIGTATCLAFLDAHHTIDGEKRCEGFPIKGLTLRLKLTL